MTTDHWITIAGMGGTFLVSFALFIWWLSSKFFGLKHLIDSGFFNIKENMHTMHEQNLDRFHKIENRLSIVERRRLP